jgi:ABC-type branched-subunit amino acid transport system ATPase component
MRFVFKTVEYIIVMNFGKKLAEGKPDDISKNENVIAAYLGQSPKVEYASA